MFKHLFSEISDTVGLDFGPPKPACAKNAAWAQSRKEVEEKKTIERNKACEEVRLQLLHFIRNPDEYKSDNLQIQTSLGPVCNIQPIKQSLSKVPNVKVKLKGILGMDHEDLEEEEKSKYHIKREIFNDTVIYNIWTTF